MQRSVKTKLLVEEGQNTVKEFQDALSAELENQPDTTSLGEQMSSNTSIITFLMEFLAVEKLSDLVPGERSVI